MSERERENKKKERGKRKERASGCCMNLLTIVKRCRWEIYVSNEYQYNVLFSLSFTRLNNLFMCVFSETRIYLFLFFLPLYDELAPQK